MKQAQATLRSKVEDVKAAKRRCKEKMQLKCSNCYSLKCKQAEENCKGFLDKAGKWIGGVVNAVGEEYGSRLLARKIILIGVFWLNFGVVIAKLSYSCMGYWVVIATHFNATFNSC